MFEPKNSIDPVGMFERELDLEIFWGRFRRQSSINGLATGDLGNDIRASRKPMEWLELPEDLACFHSRERETYNSAARSDQLGAFFPRSFVKDEI